MNSDWEDITPELAEKYLSQNAAGRTINRRAVERYARDMAGGDWHLTHQGIAFDDNGSLIDGQHRLNAIILAGVTIKMMVSRGIPAQSFSAFDIGGSRTVSDHLHIDGEKHSTQLAAILRRVWLWESGHPWSRSATPTHQEILRTYELRPELAEAALFAHGWKARPVPAIAGFCWWLFKGIDDIDADTFLEGLRTGANLAPKSPILVLRNRLQEDQQTMNRVSWARGYQRQEVSLALTILAWNHFRRRNSIAKLQLPSTMDDGSFPRPI